MKTGEALESQIIADIIEIYELYAANKLDEKRKEKAKAIYNKFIQCETLLSEAAVRVAVNSLFAIAYGAMPPNAMPLQQKKAEEILKMLRTYATELAKKKTLKGLASMRQNGT